MRYLLLALLIALASPAAADRARDYIDECNAGDTEACLAGTRAAQRDGQKDLLLKFVERGCALGNVISCSDRGMFYVTGVAGEKDVAKGVPLIISGCKKGYARACTNLGWMHYTGTGIARDVGKAAGFYKRGCDGNSAPACRNLGLMYRDGDGVRADAAKALSLFDRACDLGDVTAC